MATKRTVRRCLAALAALSLVALAVWFGSASSSSKPLSPAAPTARAPAPQASGRSPPVTASARAAYRQQLIDGVQLADQTYCSYRHASQYPHDSRPIAEHPDQIWPNSPVLEAHAMREEGGNSDPEIEVQTSQSRIYLAAGESVLLTLRALDRDKRVLPLVINSALAQGMVGPGQRPGARVALGFADDGSGADSVAGDGQASALLAPAQTGLALFHGTIRTSVRYSVAGKTGVALFDVMYSPQPPALWSGPVRAAMENGSLNFYLKLDVREPGRYLVSGRIDDARGTPLALLTFNDVLAAGPGEVKLSLFGKLARDHAPAMPLTLRDVDGYLLRENTDPDRMVMARLAGKVYVSRSHALNEFSDAQWQSPERTRYLDELGRDMNRARADLAAFDPAMALPPPCKSD